MFEFFDFISGLIENVVGFILTFFENMLALFSLVSRSIVVLGSAAAWMPDVLKLFVWAFLSYCVIINVLNKGG